ncbi:MAG TPA: HlyD family efflux transporter periplasmic adaptor subunit [Phycisphaerales bacterium]|nr:HlyD family efflux transporter periplasmic adaptor subunit [Phycisphaerales bacterium]
MNATRMWMTWMVMLALAIKLAACERGAHEHVGTQAMEEEGEEGPTNRVDIPAAVRQNLGITFARVEYRNVAQTLRVPGRFELLPTARREYRTPVGGRVELLVSQYERVVAGTPLYRVDASAWRELHEQISAMRARVDSMGPLREAHRRHEQSLAEKVGLWEERLKQLAELREAGGGSAAQLTEARATLNATQAELADVMEKDAELQAEQQRVEAELRSLVSRRETLMRGRHCAEAAADETLSPGEGFTVCAVAAGVVESVGVTPGGLVEENGHVMTVVQPEQVRFRARALQSDLGRLRDGLAASIAPPQGGSIALQDVMQGTLQIGLSADADERTVDLMMTPRELATWARAGVSAHLEVVLAGGSEELAIPQSAVVRDGTRGVIFRRDPANADKVIRMEADLGLSDGRWVVIASGVKEGDEVVLGGNYQLMLATSGTTEKAGHFHSDGTFHEGSH